MVICSDVVYPDGDVNEYLNKFFRPYKDYTKPIYALPGNHDWYDGLNGFMIHFCGAKPSVELPRSRGRVASRPRPLSTEETRRFLQAARDDRLEALYVLAVTTGMHQGEMLALKRQDIDMENGHTQRAPHAHQERRAPAPWRAEDEEESPHHSPHRGGGACAARAPLPADRSDRAARRPLQ